MVERAAGEDIGRLLCVGQQSESAIVAGWLARVANAPGRGFPGTKPVDRLHLRDHIGPMEAAPRSHHRRILSRRRARTKAVRYFEPGFFVPAASSR
jgi:hypothetical protein